MDEYESLSRRARWDETKSNAVAFVMLILSLLALYANMILLALVPLLWMAYKIGKEMGRSEAQHDLVQLGNVANMVRFPDQH